MSRFRFSGLHHVAFATSDMKKTVRYWKDLLGFKLVFGLADKEQKQYAFQVSKQMMVFFFEWKEVEPVRPKRHGEPVKGPFVFDHLALHVEEQSDLLHLQNQLVCAEQPVSDLIDHGFLHSIYSFDPNGIPLEFNWIVPTVDLNAEPVFILEQHDGFTPSHLSPEAGKWPECDEDPDDPPFIISGRERGYFP